MGAAKKRLFINMEGLSDDSNIEKNNTSTITIERLGLYENRTIHDCNDDDSSVASVLSPINLDVAKEHSKQADCRSYHESERGGKDLRVLFAFTVGLCNVDGIPH